MMTATPSKCPPSNELRDYALGRLADDASDGVFEHVRDCDVCSAELETIDDGEDSVIGNLRSADTLARFADEPACRLAVAKALGALAGEAAADAFDHDLPRQIGEYEIVRPLGRGGMGSVYLARHSKLRREVALKILVAHRLADPRMRQRFEAEMRAVGRLSHPNIVTAHDAREVEGTAVLVTEYIDGIDLSKLVQTIGPLRIADACQIVRMVAIALTYCNEQGFVHRDVKPSNIMLSRSGEVKLLDLGLARLQYGERDQVEMTAAEMQQPEIKEAEITATGQTMGTADYIAPEQVIDSRSVDVRADIYSLGCTLMKLLTGQTPFANANFPTPFTKLTAHVSTPAPRLKERLPDAPKALATLVDSMLEKEPSRRPQSPLEIAERLLPFTNGSDLSQLGQTQFAPSIDSQSQQPAMPLTEPARYRGVPVWVAVGAGFLGLAIGLLMGVLITIQYPDGTTAQITVPAGSKVTLHPSDDGPSVQGRSVQGAGAVSQFSVDGDLAPLQEIGDGTILPSDPLAFIVLHKQDGVSNGELSEATRLLESQIQSAPDDTVVGTNAGIWIQLAEGVAAPIVHQYNGNRYALAKGASNARIQWEVLRRHIIGMQASEASGFMLHVDGILKEQMRVLTGNHLQHALAIVTNGNIRVAPIIQSQISGDLRIEGNFSDEEIRYLEETLFGWLVNPLQPRSDAQPPDHTEHSSITTATLPQASADSAVSDQRSSLQGIWSSVNFGSGDKNDELIIFDQDRYYRYAGPTTIVEIGHFMLDKSQGPAQIDIQLVYPERRTLQGIYGVDTPFSARGNARRGVLQFDDSGQRPARFSNTADRSQDPQNQGRHHRLRYVGVIPEAPEDLTEVAGRVDSRWHPLLSEMLVDSIALADAMQSLKAIGLAFHNFHSFYEKFPGSQNVREGKRGINGDAPYPFSWRVAILPFVKHQDLFEQYRFDQPWDSEHNLTLIEKMPSVYRNPFAATDQPLGETNYLGFATADGGLGITGHSLAEFTDGASSTALIVAAKKSVPWTEPEDLGEGEFEAINGRLIVLKADASVEGDIPIDYERFQKMITRAGGERID